MTDRHDVPRSADAHDAADDGTQLVRRRRDRRAPIEQHAPLIDDDTVLARRPTAETADAPDDDTVLRPRTPAAETEQDEATRLVRRPSEPADDTLLSSRAPGGDTVDDTVLSRRAEDPDDATLLRPRRDAAADDATRLTRRGPTLQEQTRRRPRARRPGRETASFAPGADAERAAATERYAIRTPAIVTAPPRSASAPLVDVGDGGLAARIQRRRRMRTGLIVLTSVSAAVLLGAIATLVTLLGL